MQSILKSTAAILLIFCATAAAQKKFMEMPDAELRAAVPSLAAMRPPPDSAASNGLLRQAGKQLDAMADDSVDTNAAEAVTVLVFRDDDMEWRAQTAEFRYIVEWPLAESRAGRKPADFAAPGGFVALLNQFSTASQKTLSTRPVGTIAGPFGENVVVAFGGPGGMGLLWLDSRTATIRRIVANRILEDGTDLLLDVDYNPVRFDAVETTVILPRSAAVDATVAGGAFHSVHRFSAYHLQGIDDSNDPEQKKANSGVAREGESRREDAIELLARAGAAADPDAKSTLLAQALKLDPARAEAHTQLSALLLKKGTLTEAEREARQAIALAPGASGAQNILGMVLFTRGDTSGAAGAFRASLALRDTASAHFNLGRSLDKSGDSAAALAEYKRAAALAPESKELAAAVEARSKTAPVPGNAGSVQGPIEDAGEPIRVEVRQVLVPVVVTRGGHTLSTLRREDFHVFEDGVEQKIISFSVERPAGSPAAGAAPARTSAPATPELPRPVSAAAPHITYVVCIDALHTAFTDLVYVRDALLKLFRQEQGGGASYALMTLGAQSSVIVAGASDPQAVLKAIQPDTLSKAWLASRRGAPESLDEFRRNLTRIRNACDAAKRGDPAAQAECDSGLRSAPGEAQRMTEFERFALTAYLRQLRDLVSQLGARDERHAVLLVSDGFSMAPGELPYRMLEAYLPELNHVGLNANERITGELEPVLRLAQRRNIPFYTVDSRGLYTPPVFSAADPGAPSSVLTNVGSALSRVATSAGETLAQIAGDTGGVAYRNSNDLFAGMARAFADGREYYLLSYVPSNADRDTKFRTIAVRVSDPKATVIAKKGY